MAITRAKAEWPSGAEEREFELSDSDFRSIVILIQQACGIVLSDAKRDLVYGRLAPRLRKLGFTSFALYLQRLKGPDGATEQDALVDAITTNLTGFFRENHHFEALTNEIIPALKKDNPDRRLRIWSAGCSSGQEPYTIAMVLRRTIVDIARWDALILATDIDSNMISKARSGIYDAEAASGILPQYRGFVEDAPHGGVAMTEGLKQLIRFKRLNLIGPWPMSGPFDVIFCRNVVIYFDKDTQRVLFDRYANMLRPGGWLFIGHSESLNRVSDRFRHLGHTIYQKIN